MYNVQYNVALTSGIRDQFGGSGRLLDVCYLYSYPGTDTAFEWPYFWFIGFSHPSHAYDPNISRYRYNEPTFTWESIHTGTWCHLTSWEISVQQQPHVSHAQSAHSTRHFLLHWSHPCRLPQLRIHQLQYEKNFYNNNWKWKKSAN